MREQSMQLPKKQYGTMDLELMDHEEKPTHYAYLKDFRVEPCPLFKQHQCTNHRPYTCFYWHFANQRRRQPIRNKDGTFNYSADFYCTKYDENTGLCPDGDECPYLHRVYGDVERKYHLRYYKTALCVHATDSKGHCTKNGAHCAFAHGPEDIRDPIFDIREIQHCGELNSQTVDNRERLNFVVEDPIWHDQAYVLQHYKTEPCKKPPRLCRQGYACPFYHGGKDKRRLPHKQAGENGVESQQNGNGMSAGLLYRSTPCPNVKRGDEWGDPDICETGDNCPYCHTRTEQQFHPDIYKTTKCNDVLQHGYCPRGPFCAFAHCDAELHGERRHSSSTKRASFSSSTTGNGEPTGIFDAKLAVQMKQGKGGFGLSGYRASMDSQRRMSAVDEYSSQSVESTIRRNSLDQVGRAVMRSRAYTSGCIETSSDGKSYSAALKQRHVSGSTTGGGSDSSPSPISPSGGISYSKAPGFEREQQSPPRPWPALANTSPAPSDLHNFRDYMYSNADQIKLNLYLHHEIGCDIGGGVLEQEDGSRGHTSPPTSGSNVSSPFSPFGSGLWQHRHHHHGEDAVLDDPLPPISERDERPLDYSANLLALYTASQGIFGVHPCGQPDMTAVRAGQLTNERQGLTTIQQQNVTRTLAASMDALDRVGIRRDSMNDGNANAFLNRADDELTLIRCKLAAYEQCAKRAQQDCDAWKKEALEHKYRAQVAEQERMKAEQDRDRAIAQFSVLTNELKALQLSGLLPMNTELLPLTQLEHVRARLRAELDKVERQLQQRSNGGPMCARCGRYVNASSVTLSGVCTLCSPRCESNRQPQALTT